MRSSESHVYLFLWKNYHMNNRLKPDMIFPLLPALRSQATLTLAGRIAFYFLWFLKKVSVFYITQVTNLCDLGYKRVFQLLVQSADVYTGLVLASVLSFAPSGPQRTMIRYQMVLFKFSLLHSIHMLENRSYTKYMCPDLWWNSGKILLYFFFNWKVISWPSHTDNLLHLSYV